MKEYIYDLIPSNEFITRKELSILTNLSDREVRRAISEIKKEHTIISLSSGKGYRKMIKLDDADQNKLLEEYETIKHCINEINCKKKTYNMQLRQFIASLKVIEKKIDNVSN